MNRRVSQLGAQRSEWGKLHDPRFRGRVDRGNGVGSASFLREQKEPFPVSPLAHLPCFSDLVDYNFAV